MKTKRKSRSKYIYYWEYANGHAIRCCPSTGVSERCYSLSSGHTWYDCALESGFTPEFWANHERNFAPTITYRQWFNWVHFGQVPQFTAPALNPETVMEVTEITTTTPITLEQANKAIETIQADTKPAPLKLSGVMVECPTEPDNATI